MKRGERTLAEGRILGRRRERERIEMLLAEARMGRGGALVLTGEPGIGKTTLLDYAQGIATGMITLSCRAVEMFDLPFAGLDELLRPLIGRLDRIPAVQAAALRGALALGPPVPDSNFASCQAVLSLLLEATNEAPVLAVVDDAQWLDPSSAEALLFLARRLEGSMIALLLGSRTIEESESRLAAMDRIELVGLDRESALALLRTTGVSVAQPVADRLHAASGGNPLALLELIDRLERGQLAGREPIEEPLPTGRTAERTYVGLLDGLSPPAQLCMLLLAAAGPASVDVIERAMTFLDLRPAALEEAERTRLFRIRAGRFELRHPLVRSVVYHRAGLSEERRAVHRALAQATDGRPDMEYERAWHLAAAAWGPDAEAAAALEAAAKNARDRTGYSTAGQAFERSARLSAEPEERSRRLLEAAAAAHLAGWGERADRALALLEEASRTTRKPDRRAQIDHMRGQIATWRGHPLQAAGILTATLEDLGDQLEGRQRALMLADAAVAQCLGGEVDGAVRLARRAHVLGERLGGTAADITLTSLIVALIMHGWADQAHPLLPRYRAIATGERQAWGVNWLTSIAGPVWTWIEDYAMAEIQSTRALEEARAASALSLLPFLLILAADLDFRIGKWSAAWEAARDCAELANELSQPNQLVYALLNLARVEAAQGLEDQCRARVQRAIEVSAEHNLEAAGGYAVIALGLLELGLGNTEAAVGQLEVMARASEALHLEDPNLLRWQPDYIEALVRSGRHREAVQAAAVLQEQAQRTGGKWAVAVAAQGEGLVTTGESSVRCFRNALTLIDRTIAPFDRARILLQLARELRRQRRYVEARRLLRDSLETLQRLGARPWVEQAEQELLLSGGRRARRIRRREAEELTTGELRVAELVAAGHANKEIAMSLGISVRTVESHLRATYGKLGVHSRTQLLLRI